MKQDNTILYGTIFFGAIFFALTISNAGMFLNDEWVTGSQLDQFNHGQQLVYNEGKYGYYENGTISNYFEQRDNVLMYSMALPLLSFPILKLLSFCAIFGIARGGIILTWLLSFLALYIGCAFIWYEKFDGERNTELTFSAFLPTFVKYSWIIPIGMVFFAEYMILSYGDTFDVLHGAPIEILAIVLTNIVLFGIFTVVIKKITELVFPDNSWMQWSGWLIAISCSSILFWIGTCKDHVLTITITALILYTFLEYFTTNKNRYIYLTTLFIGLLIWIRPEIAIGIGVFIACMILIINCNDIRKILRTQIICGTTMLIGAVPAIINNVIVTGELLSHPFIMANPQYGDFTPAIIPSTEMLNIFGAIIVPPSGTASLILVLPLVALTIFISPYLISQRRNYITKMEGVLIIFGIMSVMYYILHCGFSIYFDTGIIPDVRYYSVMYMPLTLAAYSILVRQFNPEPIDIIRKIVVYTSLLLIFTLSIIASSNIGKSYQSFTIFMSVIALFCVAVSVIPVMNVDKRWFNKIIAWLVAIPLTWQLILVLVYSRVKMHAYPALIPVMEWIQNLIFV